ncbi:E3 ubiquitin ligase family protein [Candidatus Woesearchaeota archaeon]|nr:E3 ubiquitin ligase family protein [Candidatus Woesearchaeota archaeon]
MSDIRIVVYSIFGLGFGAYIFWKGFGMNKEIRVIKNTPTSKIRSMAMGRVEIYGEIIPAKGKIFKSPFSDEKCVWCKWMVEEYRSSGKSGRWITIDSGILQDHFYVKDNTGYVLVDPFGANIDIQKDNEYQSGAFRGAIPGTAKVFLDKNSIKTKGLFGFKRPLRLREYYLTPGDKIYVMGYAGDNPHIEDGSSQENAQDIMIQKGNSFFYISDSPEKEVLKKMFWKSFLSLYGGAALIIVCLFIIFAYFNIL